MNTPTDQQRVLYFSNSAGIWAHGISDALLLNRLRQMGCLVSTISCDGFQQSLCHTKESRGRTLGGWIASSKLDCLDCKFSSALISIAGDVRGVHNYWLGKHISISARQEVEALMTDWEKAGYPIELEYQGVPVAKLAAYEASLKFKSWDEGTKGKGKAQFQATVRDVALAAVAARSFFSSCEKWPTVIIRAPHYSINGAFAYVAQAFGSRVIFVDGSQNLTEDYTHLMFWDWSKYRSGNPAKQYFEKVGSPEASELKRIEKHFQVLRKSRSHKIYSPAQRSTGSSLEALGALPDRPTALLAVSSVDEAVTSKLADVNPNINYPGEVYVDQHEWVQRTIHWFARNENFQLVIRLHPREFPNRREGYSSAAGRRWERDLVNLPKNVFVDHPDKKLSLYDLLEEVSVVVTGWSSVGLEALESGKPLIIYDQTLPAYPATLGLTGGTEDEYFSNLQFALEGNARFVDSNLLLKWLHLTMNIGSSRIGGRFLASRRSSMSRVWSLLLEGLDRYLFFIYRPLDLIRGVLFEKSDKKFKSVIIDGKNNLYDSL